MESQRLFVTWKATQPEHSFHIFAVQWHTYDPNSIPPLTSVSLALLGSTAKFGPFYFTPCLSSTILVPVETEDSVLRSP